jgi:excinuclease ABC subunit C
MLPNFIDRNLLPHKPGVYIYHDDKGRVIYVGKAIDLYHRVSSYFNTGDHDPKTSALVSEIRSVETIIVESELEALILEANLIKRYLPQFNVRLTDDKDYLYIKITKEDFPRVLTARKHELSDSLKDFGPFPSSRTVKSTLKALRRVFPWCQIGKYTGRACFYHHLNLCPGPCVGKISKEDYMKNIKSLSKLLDGKKDQLMEELISEMDQASQNQDFEEAGRVKRILDGITYLTQSNRTQAYLENPNFLEDQRTLALQALQKALNLKEIPARIEGYDISNIQGHESTGSMVVLTNGEIDKSQYRKFKIKMTGRPNDVGMHREMMRRRLRHPEWPLPDVFIIDGGQGQINGVLEELKAKSIDKPIFGLAKRMEWLYSPSGRIIKLPKSNPASLLVQKLRNEAHRFAITYHRKLHGNILFR